MFEHVNTGVRAGDKFTDHSESEIVPSFVYGLVRLSLCVKCQGFLGCWTTETPIARSESCSFPGHIVRPILTLFLHLGTFPVGDVIEHTCEYDSVRKNFSVVSCSRHELLQHE